MKKIKNVIDLAPFPERTDFPGGSVVKNSPASAGDAGNVGLIPAWERSPGRGHGNPLQYAYLENHIDRGAWRAIVRGVAKSQTLLKRLSVCSSARAHTHTHTHTHTQRVLVAALGIFDLLLQHVES